MLFKFVFNTIELIHYFEGKMIVYPPGDLEQCFCITMV